MSQEDKWTQAQISADVVKTAVKELNERIADAVRGGGVKVTIKVTDVFEFGCGEYPIVEAQVALVL